MARTELEGKVNEWQASQSTRIPDMNAYIDLLLDNGDIARIECLLNEEDEARESIDNAIRSGDMWSSGVIDHCTMKINGVHVSRLSTRRILGVL